MQDRAPHTKLKAYADVGSYGLAHSLLAWGRCRVWCNKHRIPMLAPSWLRIQHRLGPLLRREGDNRMYHRLFRFPDYVSGVRRAWIIATEAHVEAETTDLEKLLDSGRNGLVVFRNRLDLNEETHFHEIHGHGLELRQNLISITKPQFHPTPYKRPHIAIHVRMGDFSPAPNIEKLRQGSKNSRIPIDWYVKILLDLRREFGMIPVRLFSDGSDADLAPLLALPDVIRPTKAPSITDLLGISQASLVISSGSGFSMWGAFLGGAPRICFPGQRFTRVLHHPENALVDLEPECESLSELSMLTIQAMHERFLLR